MIQQTLAEELRFIHEHMERIEETTKWVKDEIFLQDYPKQAVRLERIDARIDGIDEELRALNVLLRKLIGIFDRIGDIVEWADG